MKSSSWVRHGRLLLVDFHIKITLHASTHKDVCLWLCVHFLLSVILYKVYKLLTSYILHVYTSTILLVVILNYLLYILVTLPGVSSKWITCEKTWKRWAQCQQNRFSKKAGCVFNQEIRMTQITQVPPFWIVEQQLKMVGSKKRAVSI